MTGSLTLALNHTPFVITEQSQLKMGKHIAVNIELLQSKHETTLTAILARHALRPCSRTGIRVWLSDCRADESPSQYVTCSGDSLLRDIWAIAFIHDC